VVVISIAIISY